MTSYTFRKSIYRYILNTEIRGKYIPRYTRYMTPYDRAWDIGVYTEYMWVYDGICQVVRIPDDYDIIANSPAMSDGKSHRFGYGIMKIFNVSIPSCRGELGRRKEQAEVFKLKSQVWMVCALRPAPGWQRLQVQCWRWRPTVVCPRRDEV